jgi:hypothetical protein
VDAEVETRELVVEGFGPRPQTRGRFYTTEREGERLPSYGGQVQDRVEHTHARQQHDQSAASLGSHGFEVVSSRDRGHP